jgi:hypothetical protein
VPLIADGYPEHLYPYTHLLKYSNQQASCHLENAIFEVNGSKMAADEKKRSRPKPQPLDISW